MNCPSCGSINIHHHKDEIGVQFDVCRMCGYKMNIKNVDL